MGFWSDRLFGSDDALDEVGDLIALLSARIRKATRGRVLRHVPAARVDLSLLARLERDHGPHLSTRQAQNLAKLLRDAAVRAMFVPSWRAALERELKAFVAMPKRPLGAARVSRITPKERAEMIRELEATPMPKNWRVIPNVQAAAMSTRTKQASRIAQKATS